MTSIARVNVRCRQSGLQREHEPGPRVVADRGGARAAHEVGDDRDRVVGLVPRPDRERIGVLDDTRGLEPRHHEHRLESRSAGTTSMVSRSSGIAS